MLVVVIMTMVDNEYGVTLKTNDLKKAVTIKDLFETIRAYRTNSAGESRMKAFIKAIACYLPE